MSRPAPAGVAGVRSPARPGGGRFEAEIHPDWKIGMGGVQMPAVVPVRGPAKQLMGRGAEGGVLDRLVEAVRAGAGRALVVHGEPGVGKTALLDYLAGQASGSRVARAGDVQLGDGACHLPASVAVSPGWPSCYTPWITTG